MAKLGATESEDKNTLDRFISAMLEIDKTIDTNKEKVINRSKAVGEPPFMLAISSFIALKDAVYNANKGKNSENLIAPATAENILKSLH